MTKRLNAVLLTTALTIPFATSAFAQSDGTACSELERIISEGLPAGMEESEARLRDVATEGDDEICVIELTDIRDRMADSGQTAQDDGQVVDTERTTVTLEDEVVIEGQVILDQEPPSVDVTAGETEVEIEPGNPSVNVSEGQPEIVLRQAPAKVTIDMPAPTIRIEQAAPEIIITMPDPEVSVGAAEPRVEVRQADPKITVNQAPPQVELDLRKAQDASSSGGIGVTDRRSGTDYTPGAATDRIAMEDAEVNVSTSEPQVMMVETSEPSEVTIERAEPNVRFEQADPEVSFTSQGEPQVDFVQSGEPTVRFNQPEDGEQGAAAQGDTAGQAPESDMAESDTAQAPDAEPAEQPDAAMAPEGEDPAQTPAAEEQSDTVTTEAPVQLRGPRIEREGYEPVATGDMEVDTLTGLNVYGTQDEDVGEIGDLVLDADGEVESVIIDVGGFLGIGEKHIAMPYDSLSFLRAADGDTRVYVDATKEDVEQMPEYTE